MRQAAPTGGGLLFPANFNPVHEGDWEACEVAEELLGGRVELNLEAHPPKEFTCRHPRPAVTVDAIILDRS